MRLGRVAKIGLAFVFTGVAVNIITYYYFSTLFSKFSLSTDLLFSTLIIYGLSNWFTAGLAFALFDYLKGRASKIPFFKLLGRYENVFYYTCLILTVLAVLLPMLWGITSLWLTQVGI